MIDRSITCCVEQNTKLRLSVHLWSKVDVIIRRTLVIDSTFQVAMHVRASIGDCDVLQMSEVLFIFRILMYIIKYAPNIFQVGWKLFNNFSFCAFLCLKNNFQAQKRNNFQAFLCLKIIREPMIKMYQTLAPSSIWLNVKEI